MSDKLALLYTFNITADETVNRLKLLVVLI